MMKEAVIVMGQGRCAAGEDPLAALVDRGKLAPRGGKQDRQRRLGDQPAK
jgi:hypothetical protein